MAKLPAGRFLPFVAVGPDIAFRVSAEQVFECTSREPLVVPAEDQISTMDITLDCGGGVEYRLTETLSVVLTGRYSLGLTNISELDGTTWKSRGIQILLGAGVAF